MGNSTSTTKPISFREKIIEEMKILAEIKPPDPTTLDEFLNISSKFPVKFPIETARIKSQTNYSKKELEDFINSAYPIIHEKLLPFLTKFILIKQINGTAKEKKLYEKMHVLDEVERMLKNRPMVFVGSHDRFILLDESLGTGGFGSIGQKNQVSNLPINKYMTYDEIKLSALLSISSKSYFINNGSRCNEGEIGIAGEFQKDGVIVGQVGARFQKQGKMDWQDCIITPEQNCNEFGYGVGNTDELSLLKEWAYLWELEYFPTWDEVQKLNGNQYSETSFDNIKFNEIVYKNRMKMTIEILLHEANDRGRRIDKKVYLHVVGLGLGEWRLAECQAQVYVDSWGEVLLKNTFDYIGCIDFSWIPVSSCKNTSNGEKLPDTNVIIYFSKRSLHDPVPDNMILVCNFAWDGNSLPGNEYWAGNLSSSGDPAAACSSGIAELHNSLINPQITSTNLHIATKGGIIHVADYAKHWIDRNQIGL